MKKPRYKGEIISEKKKSVATATGDFDEMEKRLKRIKANLSLAISDDKDWKLMMEAMKGLTDALKKAQSVWKEVKGRREKGSMRGM